MKIKFNRFNQTLVYTNTPKEPFKIVKDNVKLAVSEQCEEPSAYWKDYVFTVNLPLNSSGELLLWCSDKKGLFQTLKEAGVDVEMPVTFEKFTEGDVVYALLGSFANESGRIDVEDLYDLSVVKGTVKFDYKDDDTFWYVMIQISDEEYIRVPYRWVEHSLDTLKDNVNNAIEKTVNKLKNDIEKCKNFLKTI